MCRVSDGAGCDIYEFDEIGPVSGSGPVIPVAPIVPVAPLAPLRGMYNLICQKYLSKANAETSLLARLCNAICNCEAG